MQPSPKSTDWAYLAGFVDGEGCISTTSSKSGQFYPRLVVAQSDFGQIERLREKFLGLGRVHVKQQKHYRPQLVWTLRGEELLVFLENLLPYLDLKKRQAEVAILIHNRAGDARKLNQELKELKHLAS